MTTPNPRTIAHLVAGNPASEEVLQRTRNSRRLSTSADGSLGFEMGYHVAASPSLAVVATIGRTGDLEIDDPQVAKVHLEFRVEPELCSIFLSRPGNGPSDITIYPSVGSEFTIVDTYGLDFDKSYTIRLGDYAFRLVWSSQDFDVMRAKIHDELSKSAHNSRYDTMPPKWNTEQLYFLRIARHQGKSVDEETKSRVLIQKTHCGGIYKTRDRANNNAIAVKVFRADQDPRLWPSARAEIEMLSRCQHDNITMFLGHSGTMGQEIAMYVPLATGSLSVLLITQGVANDKIWVDVLRDMLCALDYLDWQHITHRDVKPANILYDKTGFPERPYHYRLTDFGIATTKPERGCVGTWAFTAPEVQQGKEYGPKADIWSLFPTVVNVKVPDWEWSTVDELVKVVHFPDWPELGIMSRLDPSRRASAAQCLKQFFGGQGLTSKGPVAELVDPPCPLRLVTVASGNSLADAAVGGAVGRQPTCSCELAALRAGAPSVPSIATREARFRNVADRRTRGRRRLALADADLRTVSTVMDGEDVIMGGTDAANNAHKRRRA